VVVVVVVVVGKGGMWWYRTWYIKNRIKIIKGFHNWNKQTFSNVATYELHVMDFWGGEDDAEGSASQVAWSPRPWIFSLWLGFVFKQQQTMMRKKKEWNMKHETQQHKYTHDTQTKIGNINWWVPLYLLSLGWLMSGIVGSGFSSRGETSKNTASSRRNRELNFNKFTDNPNAIKNKIFQMDTYKKVWVDTLDYYDIIRPFLPHDMYDNTTSCKL
jgi:hypothetical protein